MSYNVNELERVLVRLYVEKALFEKGIAIYDSVCERLCQNYRCDLEDCYEYPEYLLNVLKDNHRNDTVDIILSIKNDLKEFYHHKRITKFLDILSDFEI